MSGDLNRETCYPGVPSAYPAHIETESLFLLLEDRLRHCYNILLINAALVHPSTSCPLLIRVITYLLTAEHEHHWDSSPVTKWDGRLGDDEEEVPVAQTHLPGLHETSKEQLVQV